jgi:hypothetical protein
MIFISLRFSCRIRKRGAPRKSKAPLESPTNWQRRVQTEVKLSSLFLIYSRIMMEDDQLLGFEIPMDTVHRSSSDGNKPGASKAAAAVPIFNLDELNVDGGTARSSFEMMEIHITVYSLSGILYQTKEVNEKRRQRQERTGKWRRGNKALRASGTASTENSDMPSTSPSAYGGTALSTITESTSRPSLLSFEHDKSLAPTTAVVSTTRHDPNSDRPMETFLPSLPLHRVSRGDRSTLRYSARWTSGASTVGGTEESSSRTMKILRLMYQQGYQPQSTIGDTSTYEHEKVDLCIFAGRAKELIPLGVISFIVTGDEESETLLNLPVKIPTAGFLYEKHFKQTKRSRKSRTPLDSFSSDPKHAFVVGANATLKVGVRVFPQRKFIEAEERSTTALTRDHEERVFESVLQRIIDEDLLMNLSDENSLIQKIVEGQKKKKEVQVVQEEPIFHPEVHEVTEIFPAAEATPRAATQPTFFCSSFNQFFQQNECPRLGRSSPEIPEQVVTVQRRRDLPVDFPLSLVSSVSDSVTTDADSRHSRQLGVPKAFANQ